MWIWVKGQIIMQISESFIFILNCYFFCCYKICRFNNEKSAKSFPKKFAKTIIPLTLIGRLYRPGIASVLEGEGREEQGSGEVIIRKT